MPFQYAERMSHLKSSAIREILKVTQSPDILSFAGGLPDPGLFPVQDLSRAMQSVTDKYAHKIFQYSPTEGWPALKEYIAGLYDADPVEILPVSGSQQGLDLIARCLLNPEDSVIVERPGYLGALQIFQSYQAKVIEVPLDESGPEPNALEKAFAQGQPKFFYTIPNFQNPTGITMSLHRRRHVLELAQRYSVLIIEDDPYGEIRFRGEPLPSLWSLSAKGSVVHLGTFSKTIAPGLRVGWVLAPVHFISRLVLLKQATDLHTGTLAQAILAELLATFDHPAHLTTLRQIYGSRAKTMLQTLEQQMPSGVAWTTPEGGMFIWVTLPSHVDTTPLLHRAVTKAKVAYVPGEPFFAHSPSVNCLRLNFSNVSEDNIQKGISCLCGLVNEELSNNPSPSQSGCEETASRTKMLAG